jgi:hypothetical protein
MISIKKYLGGGDGINRTEEGLREVVSLFVQNLGESAVQADRQELEDFRKEIASVYEALTPDLALEKMLVFAGAVNQSLETYNRRITRTIAGHDNDFQGVLKLLRDHLAALAGANSDSVDRLGEIGTQMETSNGFKNLQDLKLHLAQCLSGLRAEALDVDLELSRDWRECF